LLHTKTIKKTVSGWCFTPDHTTGAYDAPQTPLLTVEGALEYFAQVSATLYFRRVLFQAC